jgi:hypothetical protein
MLLTITATGILAFLLYRVLSYSIRKKRKALQIQKLLVRFSELGTANDLAFSSQLILPNRIIGLDGIKKTLLVMEVDIGESSWYLVRLDEMHSCKVKMLYRSLNAGEANDWRDEKNLEKIVIRFQKKDQENIVLLPFYESGKNNVMEATALARKADYWESMLSKLINNNLKKIA